MGNKKSGRNRENPERRFWRFVRKTDKCWEWTGCIHPKGYGYFWDGHKVTKAHRFSYQLHIGNIPDGLLVCHTCDIRNCVNPKHLWTGTNTDNMRDMADKGRGVYPDNGGERNHFAKLNSKLVLSIRELYGGGKHSMKEVGKAFNISAANVCLIVNNKTWK